MAEGPVAAAVDAPFCSQQQQPPVDLLAHRRLFEYCKRLESRVEEQQEVLARTLSSSECERHAAQEAQAALLRVEAEATYTEGSAARREAQLRTELLERREEHCRERERLRVETRRLQVSIREMQSRTRAEGEARAGASEQAESLRQQLTTAQAELQRRAKEGREAKNALNGLERRLEQFADLSTWMVARCSEALGEYEHPSTEGIGAHADTTDDGLKRILGRTLTLLRRRASSGAECDKENIGNVGLGAAGLAAPPPSSVASTASPHAKASEVMLRLATVQSELLRAQAQNEELESSRRGLQARLGESEEVLQALHGRPGVSPLVGLRTEQRGRLRAAEEGQKRLQRQVFELQEDAKFETCRHDEERERMRGRISSLQRAKEAGERYVETEEDSWIHAQRQERTLEVVVAGLRAELRAEEADARDASADAVEARAAAQVAEVAKRRLEGDVLQLRALVRTSERLGGAEQPPPAVAAAPAAGGGAGESAMEAEHTAAVERIGTEAQVLRRALDAETAIAETLQESMERQRLQQEKVDEAKRAMVQSAMDEQAQTLRREFLDHLDAARDRCEVEACELRGCTEEQREQQWHLEHAQQSVTYLQRRANTFENELQRHLQGLARREDEICEFSRMELLAYSEAEESHMEARCEAAVREREDERVAHAVVAVRAECQEELAAARGAHAAAVAAVHGEYSGECAALRSIEGEARKWCEDEICTARAAREALAEAARAAVQGEAEEAQSARRALRAETTAAGELHVALRDELRDEQVQQAAVLRYELVCEMRKELLVEAREEVCRDVRQNPCNEIRRELSNCLRHELCDQIRTELRSELQASRSTLSPGLSGEQRRTRRTRSALSPSTPPSGLVGQLFVNTSEYTLWPCSLEAPEPDTTPAPSSRQSSAARLLADAGEPASPPRPSRLQMDPPVPRGTPPSVKWADPLGGAAVAAEGDAFPRPRRRSRSKASVAATASLLDAAALPEPPAAAPPAAPAPAPLGDGSLSLEDQASAVLAGVAAARERHTPWAPPAGSSAASGGARRPPPLGLAHAATAIAAGGPAAG